MRLLHKIGRILRMIFRRLTLMDSLDKGMKKDLPVDCCYGVRIAAIASMQLGKQKKIHLVLKKFEIFCFSSGVDVGDTLEKMFDYLRAKSRDQSASIAVRSDCCTVLSICTTFSVEEIQVFFQKQIKFRRFLRFFRV